MFLILLLRLGHSAQNQPKLAPQKEKCGVKSYIRNHLTTRQWCGSSANRLYDPQIYEQAQDPLAPQGTEDSNSGRRSGMLPSILKEMPAAMERRSEPSRQAWRLEDRAQKMRGKIRWRVAAQRPQQKRWQRDPQDSQGAETDSSLKAKQQIASKGRHDCITEERSCGLASPSLTSG
ncbi:unnamed protein product [Rangifer tarandus platyrhynchus]|uniref:Uncharacterized protein n=2 Tax=Rangifer tarandus platyrhynchus TaxID=3082113 RepID=A0ACB0DY59_RANTA|nr:unnamed protein product [Rangifer tarandus platyrhynchus]CAI9693094.1 unnamed protein product [Rangifer tarandus platyrhynchus]